MVDVVAEATHQQKQRHLLQKAKLRSLSQSRLHYKPYQVHNYFCSWILVISKEIMQNLLKETAMPQLLQCTHIRLFSVQCIP